nr:developmental pluripotency-associated protein 2 isoform X1 [Cavia porcellus]
MSAASNHGGQSFSKEETSSLKEELDEENVILTLVPVTEECEQQMEPDVWSPADVRGSAVHLPQRQEELKNCPRAKCKAAAPPLPTFLPPVNEVSRNTLRTWCQHFNLSTDGQKIEVYLRLLKHAYPQQECNVPGTPMEAKYRKHRAGPKKKSMRREGASLKEEATNVVEVMTSATESILASWARIASRVGEPKAVASCSTPKSTEAFLPQAPGVRWCVVHGQLRSADVKGWVRLQFRSGHTWVPNSPKKMIALFLLPACIFPSPGTEDNMLCPECVQRNKKMMKKLIMGKRKRHLVGDQSTSPQHMPP